MALTAARTNDKKKDVEARKTIVFEDLAAARELQGCYDRETPYFYIRTSLRTARLDALVD